MKELTNTGMVEVYNHQYLWDNRQFPKIHDAFTDIWGTEKLWVTIDRANLNLPIRPGYATQSQVYWNQVMAASLVVSLPVVAGFLLLQRYFVAGLTAGAVK